MKNIYLSIISIAVAGAATAQNFPTLDTTFNTKVVLAPSPFVITPLFSGASSMVVKPASLGGGTAPAKQNHDYTGLVSINDSTEAYLNVNHELSSKDDNLDDGGGMTAFKVKRTNGTWAVNGAFNYVDFKSTVGGTYVNCGGADTPNKTTVTAEEFPPVDNAALFAGGFRDTSNYVIPAGSAFAGSTLKRYENFGWMVDVNPTTGMATEKYYKMGRFSHEGGLFLADGKTVYLTDDNTPGVFCKYIATTANDYTDGQLYAYKQNANGQGGTWLALPMDLNSLKDTRKTALTAGATMFNRLEWVVAAKNGRIFLTETGRDDVSNLKSYMKAGTNMPAYHLMQPGIHDGDSTFTDYYGRVLEFVEGTNTMQVFVEGGNAAGDMRKNLASPDGLATVRVNGRDFLVILEDLIGSSQNRSGGQNNNTCEAYIVDASKPSVTVADLTRFMIGPNGAELTGGTFMPDGKTFFINIQHPTNTNTPPYNNSTTVAVTNYAQFLTTLGVDDNISLPATGFSIYPNPASREIRLNKTTDIAIYNMNGVMIRVVRNTDSVDVSELSAGMYFIQTVAGEVQRLIIE